MTTLISQTHGGRTRRCDARCYNGKHARCKCICGGVNHGKGLEKAIENTREMAVKLLEMDNTKIARDILAAFEQKERMAG